MSTLKTHLETIAKLTVVSPTQTECTSASLLAHQVASDTGAPLETRVAFSALAQELAAAPEKVTAADRRASRLMGQLVALASKVLPTAT